MQTKLQHLRQILSASSPLVIAYSGGVDSAFLLAEAHQALGGKMLGVIADSPSLPRDALRDALKVAAQIGAPVEVVKTDELANPEYVANSPGRCYFCKAELFLKLDQLAISRGYKAIAYGENADDMQHDRPGRKAAKEFQIIAPLRDAGLTKAEIRAASRTLDLPTADAPAQPCLSSRIPWGTAVTPEALAMVEAAEKAVRSLGFRIFRVRHMVPVAGLTHARVLIAPEEMNQLETHRAAMESAILAAGYSAVEFDPEGYRGPGL